MGLARSCAADGDVGVSSGLCAHGLLRQPVEKQAWFAGAAPVEPELELVEVGLQVLRLGSALQGSVEPAFDLGLNSGDGGEEHVS